MEVKIIEKLYKVDLEEQDEFKEILKKIKELIDRYTLDVFQRGGESGLEKRGKFVTLMVYLSSDKKRIKDAFARGLPFNFPEDKIDLLELYVDELNEALQFLRDVSKVN